MKTITLIRHAEAMPAKLGQEDIHRELSKRGEEMAVTMGQRLAQAGVIPDLVYVSSATRAQTTCHLLCRAIQFPEAEIQVDPEIYFSHGTAFFFEHFNRLDEARSHVFIVGHNPYISDVANQLCAQRQAVSMSVCGVFRATFDVDYWAEVLPETGSFVSYDVP